MLLYVNVSVFFFCFILKIFIYQIANNIVSLHKNLYLDTVGSSQFIY